MKHDCPIHPSESRITQCLPIIYSISRIRTDDCTQIKSGTENGNRVTDIQKLKSEWDKLLEMDFDRIRAYGGNEFKELSNKKVDWLSLKAAYLQGISPPSEPRPPSWAENGEWLMIGIGFFMGVIGSILWAVNNSVIAEWVAIIGWLMVVLMNIIALLDLNKRYQSYRHSLKTYDSHMKHWYRLRYCFNCEKVFDPYTGETFAPSETHDHISQKLKSDV